MAVVVELLVPNASQSDFDGIEPKPTGDRRTASAERDFVVTLTPAEDGPVPETFEPSP